MENNDKKRRKRKRIRVFDDHSNPITISELTDDFLSNAASPNAKFLCEFQETWTHEFWIDKHYLNRKNFGDEAGPREGIEEQNVENLVKKSIPHLFYFALKHSFKFINHPPKPTFPIRLVVQEIYNTKTTLNVVVEFHFLDTNKYEITVRTAMSIDDFKLQDNQYVIQLGGNESTLFLMKNKTLNELDTFVI